MSWATSTGSSNLGERRVFEEMKFKRDTRCRVPGTDAGLVMTRGGLWWLVVTRGGLWWLLVARGGLWWLVMTRGDSWWLVVTCARRHPHQRRLSERICQWPVLFNTEIFLSSTNFLLFNSNSFCIVIHRCPPTLSA